MQYQDHISTAKELFDSSDQLVKLLAADQPRTNRILDRTRLAVSESLLLIRRSDELLGALTPIRPHPNAYSLRI